MTDLFSSSSSVQELRVPHPGLSDNWNPRSKHYGMPNIPIAIGGIALIFGGAMGVSLYDKYPDSSSDKKAQKWKYTLFALLTAGGVFLTLYGLSPLAVRLAQKSKAKGRLSF